MGLPTEVPLHQPPGEGSDEEQQRQQQEQEQELDAQLAQRHWVPGFLSACGGAGELGIAPLLLLVLLMLLW
jgi:hypothetical protein